MLMHSYNSPAGLVGSTFGALLIIFAIATQQWIFIVLGLVMLLYLPWTLFLKSRTQLLNNPAFQEPLQYTLDEEGLTVSQGEVQEKMAWEDMHKAGPAGGRDRDDFHPYAAFQSEDSTVNLHA